MASKSVDKRRFGFTCVEPVEGIAQVWADPRTIQRNELNPRVHPDEQTQVVGDMIEEFGWLRPLLFNLVTGRLIDGHDRLDIAINNGYEAVPVWVISCREDQEAEVILSLDESGRMATWDRDKASAMLSRLTDTSASVRKLIDGLAKREGLAEYVDRCKEKASVFLTEDSPPPGDMVTDPEHVDPAIAERAMAQEPPSLSASRVRLVQLFVDKDQVELFNEWVDDLQEMWGVTSVTDAVMRTLSDAHLAYLRGGRRSRS